MIAGQLLGLTSAEYAKFMALPKEERDKIMQAFTNAISNKQQVTDTLKSEINKRP
jgi:hypothetical protein